jgi:hypothetical protein
LYANASALSTRKGIFKPSHTRFVRADQSR